MRHARAAGFLAVIVAAAAFAGDPATSIVDTPHNLSSSGPGSIHALGEDRVCIFCHTPHGGRSDAPLWNRSDSGASYTPYDSPTLVATPGQPTGSSKLCLSCHDGTVALGDLLSETAPIAMSGSSTLPPGHGLIGTDLRDDHPISFPYAESLSGGATGLAPPGSWDPAIRLDAAGLLQCTTCHNPHDNRWGAFLVTTNEGASLCRSCHTIDGFEGSPHAESTATWRGAGRNPWPHTEFTDVASNACLNCHQSHHAPGNAALLTAVKGEDTCLACHDGGVARTDIAAALNKPFRHPIAETSAAHRGGEVLTGDADHVTCADCHNPHRAVDREAAAPHVPGMLEGVSGLTIGGTFVAEAAYEYEVCLKCHAEESRREWTSITRAITSNSIRREFAPDSPSYHPVAAPGVNPDVPSLIAPLTTDSMIYCSDCHGDDTSGVVAREDSSGAGPHGSRHRFLLAREYRTEDFTSESATAYALCYGCHDRASILGNESFQGHRLHIVEQSTPCSACHDAHGIDAAEGSAARNAALINFDRSIVQPLPSSGVLEYDALTGDGGTCALRCHGADHDGWGF